MVIVPLSANTNAADIHHQSSHHFRKRVLIPKRSQKQKRNNRQISFEVVQKTISRRIGPVAASIPPI